MSKLPLLSALALASLLAVAPARADVTLTASSWVPPQHPLTVNILGAWAKEVEAATQGRVKINILPKAPVAAPQTFDAVKDAVIDVSFTVHGYTPGRFLLTKATEFGFLGDSAESISVAYERIFRRHLVKADEHKGVHVISVFSHGPGQMYSAKNPIATVADLANMKIRVGGGIVNDYTKALGASPLLKPAGESFQILQSGVADGIFFPAESIQGFKLQSLIKHATRVPGGLYNTSFVMMMNEGKYNALPKADRDAIDKLSGEHFARLAGKAWDQADAAGWEAMKAAGISITTASPAFVAEAKAKTGPIEQAWYGEVKAKGIDGAAVMRELREEIAKVAAGK